MNIIEKKFKYIANYCHGYSILKLGTRSQVYEYGKAKKKGNVKVSKSESSKEIYQSLSKGKTWFFKLLKMYKLNGNNWGKEHSRKIHQGSKKIDREKEQ